MNWSFKVEQSCLPRGAATLPYISKESSKTLCERLQRDTAKFGLCRLSMTI
jgi:hypothetical protein